MSIWIWGTSKTAWVEDWLVHLPTGATIAIDNSGPPGPAITLGLLGQNEGSTYLYWATDMDDAREYMERLARILGAVQVVE